MMTWITSFFAGLFAGLGWIVLGAAVLAAVLIHVFGKVLPSWVPAIVIVVLGAAFVGSSTLKDGQLHAEQKAHLETKLANAAVLQDIANKSIAAHRAAMRAAAEFDAQKQALEAAVANTLKKAKEDEDAYLRHRRAADDLNGRLRDQLGAVRRAYGADCDAANAAVAAAGRRPPAGCAVRVLADLLAEEQRRARIYAEEADTARRRGLTCERLYDAARSALAGGKP